MKKYARIIAVVMIAFIMLQCNKSEAAKPGTENQAKTSQNISGKENHKHNDKDDLKYVSKEVEVRGDVVKPLTLTVDSLKKMNVNNYEN